MRRVLCLYVVILALLTWQGLARDSDRGARLAAAAEGPGPNSPGSLTTGDTVCAVFCKGLGPRSGNNHPRWPIRDGFWPDIVDSSFKWCNVSYDPQYQDSFYHENLMLVSLSGYESSDDNLPAYSAMRFGALRWDLDRLPRDRKVLGAYICLRTFNSVMDYTTRDDIGLSAFLDTTSAGDWWRGPPGGVAQDHGDTNHCAASWNRKNWRTGALWPEPLDNRRDWWDWGVPARTISHQGWRNEAWPLASDDSLVIDVTDIVQLYLNVPQLQNNGFWIGGYYQGYSSQPYLRCGSGTGVDYWQPFLVVYYVDEEYQQPWWGKPLVAMFSTDDQSVDNYCVECGDTTYKAIFDSAGFKYTLFVRGDAISGKWGYFSYFFMDSAEIHQMWAEGYEIGQHEFYHPQYITPDSPESLARDLARDSLASGLGIPYRDLKVIAWSYGWWDTHYVRAAIDSGYIGARGLAVGEAGPACCTYADGANYLLWKPLRDGRTSPADTVLMFSYAISHGNSDIWGNPTQGYLPRADVFENVNDALADCWHNNNMPLNVFWHRNQYDAPWRQISWMIEAIKYKQNLLSVRTHGDVLEYYRQPEHHVFCASRDTAHYVCGATGRAWMRPADEANSELSATPTGPDGPPEAPVLAGNVPNPFNALTRIRYEVPAGSGSGDVQIRIYDVAGRLVRTLVAGPAAAGTHSISWDGKDDAGAAAASGVYLYQLRWNGKRTTRRMLLVR